MNLTIVAATDVGRKREKNEDAFWFDESLGVVVVADGMGGHAAGEVASRLAVEVIQERLRSAANRNGGTLTEAIAEANRRIYHDAQSNVAYRSMGTTVAVALFSPVGVHVAHVGDSRVYSIRNDELTLVTRDHSLLNEYLDLGVLSPEAASGFPRKNVITRALGHEEDVMVDVQCLPVKDGDHWLVCSDGLSDLVQDEEILVHVRCAGGDLVRACQGLIELANARGGRDNITVVIVRVGNVGKGTSGEGRVVFGACILAGAGVVAGGIAWLGLHTRSDTTGCPHSLPRHTPAEAIALPDMAALERPLLPMSEAFSTAVGAGHETW